MVRVRYTTWWVGVIGFLLTTAGRAQSSRASVTASTASVVESPSVIAVIDVTVLPMDRERTLAHQTVLVQGERITVVGAVARVRVPATALRIDGRGKFLLPGLADMHYHLAAHDSAGAEGALALLLANGVTTLRNMDYIAPARSGGLYKLEGDALLRLRARVAAGAVLGPRIYTSGVWALGETPTEDDVVREVARYKAAGYDFIKVHDEHPVTYADLVVAARAAGLPVAGHVPRGVPLAQALAAHQASIEHLTGYEAAFADSSQIPVLAGATKQAGVWNCPTLLLAELVTVGVARDSVELRPELAYASASTRDFFRTISTQIPANTLLRAKQQLVKALQDSGGRLLVGTDAVAPYTMPGFSVHHELAALVRAGLTPYQALSAATRNVAEYFGTLAESGTVAAGKRADLVLVDGNPLADIRQTTRISGVMLGGRWFSRAKLDRQLAALVGTVTVGFH